MLVEETRPQQHMRALQLAQTIRLARCTLRQRIAAGDVTVAEVIRDTPREAQTMTVGALLRSQRLWGTTRTRSLLRRLGLPESKPLGTLTPRQRDLLLAELA